MHVKGADMLTAEQISHIQALGIDYADMMNRFDGNEALFIRLASRFVDDAHLAAIEEALRIGDAEDVYAESHALKGLAGNLSMTRLFEAAACIAEEARRERMDMVGVHMPAFRNAYKQAKEAAQFIASTHA